MNKIEKRKTFIINVFYIAIVSYIIFYLVKYALPFLMPFAIAYAIAFILKPLINKLTKITPIGRKPIAIITLIFTFLIIAAILTLVGTRTVVFITNFVSKLPQFYKTDIEPTITGLTDWLEKYVSELDPAIILFLDSVSETLTKEVYGIITSISKSALSSVTNFATSIPWLIVNTIVCIVSSFFLTVDYYRITSFAVKQLPEKARRMVFVVKDYTINVLFKFFKAYFIIIMITFVEIFVGLLILKVPNALLIALGTAFVDILPILGTGTIMIPWAIISLLTGNYATGIGLAVLYAIITVVRQVLEPRIVGTQIGLYPLLTLLCMFVGASMFGIVGLFGLPITVTVLIHLHRSGEIKLYKEFHVKKIVGDGKSEDAKKNAKQ